jgi:hypothetical protein
MGNEIDWQGIEADFVAGWIRWCCFGVAVGGSFEFRDGFEAAARSNDKGGARPTSDDAADAAREYVAACQASAVSDYCTFAD